MIAILAETRWLDAERALMIACGFGPPDARAVHVDLVQG